MRQKRILKRGRAGGGAAQTGEEKNAEKCIERSRLSVKKKEEEWFAHENKHSPTRLLMHTQEVVSLGSVLQWGTGQTDPGSFASRQSVMGFLFLVRNQCNLTVVLYLHTHK